MCSFLLSPILCHLLAGAENSSSDQRQACKKHELYVSFRDLGWQVRGLPDWPWTPETFGEVSCAFPQAPPKKLSFLIESYFSSNNLPQVEALNQGQW